MIGIKLENDTHSDMATFLEYLDCAKTVEHQSQVTERLKILGIKQFRQPAR
jgi:hypothetical protein